MKLPAIPEPERYAGLYLYDFGTHVSVGYTAAEVCVLRESAAYRHGMAYQVYRIDEGGAIELRGVHAERLIGQEAMCFLRADPAGARGDYDALCATAAACPLPCIVEMQLARLEAFDPPNVTALTYAVSATNVLAGWLSLNSGDPGDRVVGGMDAYATLVASEGERITSCQLPALLNYEDRPAQEVLRSVHNPLQR